MVDTSEECPIKAAITLLRGKWKIMILWQLLESSKPVRFGELKRLVPGITEKMLIQQLRELERDSIIERNDYQENPPRVEYRPSPLGRELTPVFTALEIWGLKLNPSTS
jgi:DNA-binding HxlR family transcriptional regulator